MAIAPVWFAAQKLDWTNEALINKLRLAYLGEVIGFFALTGYLYVKVGRGEAGVDEAKGQRPRIIFVKQKPSFNNPNPSGWCKSSYPIYETAETLALAQQLLFVVALTLVLHFYFDVKQSLLMQAAMLPLTFMDHAVVRRHLLGAFFPEARPYGEKYEGEELPEDDAKGGEGDDAKAEAAGKAAGKKKTKAGGKAGSKAEDEPPPLAVDPRTDLGALKALIGDTWDSGKAAQYKPLMAALTKANVNTKAEAEYTSLMIVAGGVGHVGREVGQLLALGADPLVADDEGWTALHWAAFHGNLSGARALLKAKEAAALVAAVDDEGKTALDLAKEELEAAAASDGGVDPALLGPKKEIVAAIEAAGAAAAAGGGGGGAGQFGDSTELQEID